VRRPLVVAAIVALVLGIPRAPLKAQTVVEVAGGGSTLLNGYGATANFWRPGADGWIGIGYLDGLRLGAFLRTGVGRDTLRLGNDVLQVRFPTDIFTPGHPVLVQGAGWAGGDERTSYLAFGGSSSSGLGAQTFQPTSVEQPMGALMLARRLTSTLRATTTAVFAERQTIVPGLEWRPRADLTTALAAGVGSDRPYAASSLMWRRGPLGVRAAYAWNPSRFRRVPVPTPYQTENERENLELTYELMPNFTIGVGRQNFVQDSADSRPAVRASGNSAFLGGRIGEWRLTAGVYDSRAQGIRNVSSYSALGRELTPWLDAEVFLLQSRPEGRPTSTTPLANLRWRLGPRLGLMQHVTYHDGRTSVLFGANLLTGFGEFGVDYTVVHQPFQPFSPFRSALNLTARLQLGRYSTSFGTYVRPDGAVDYSANGSTFLYTGGWTGAEVVPTGSGSIARYLVRGTVRDEHGAPVEGAALDIGGQVVFANASGAFFLRTNRPRRFPLIVRLDEFLLPGRWALVSAPDLVEARGERDAPELEVVLHRIDAPSLTPPDTKPQPAPADTIGSTAQDTGTAAVVVVKSAADSIDVDRDVLGPHRIPAHFAWASRHIPANAKPGLDSLASSLVALPTLVVEIQGHADATGSARSNLALSRARAQEVRRYLMARGVPAERIRIRGVGATTPVADNRTRKGRSLNRRVELHRPAGEP
jgi:outer membrane protein OmpA-like peptidoglycan-associated protein